MKAWIIERGSAFRELPLLPEDKSLDDLTRRLPQGLYTTFRTYGGSKKVYGLQAHLDRLFSTSTDFQIELTAAEADVRDGLRKILTSFSPNEARVRICRALIDQPGKIFVMAEDLTLLSKDVYEKGVSVLTTHAERNSPRIKSTSFIEESVPERKALTDQGILEGLIVRHDLILEGLTSNFYSVKNSRIVTARDGILLGVTRALVLRLARSEGLEIEYRSLRIDEIGEISEAFITSSSRGLVPIVAIDGTSVGQGMPGVVAILLRNKYESYVLEKAETI